MRQESYKPKIPDLMEAIFDAGYLIFDLIAAILFFVVGKGNALFTLYGILTLTLCGGDAFHLNNPVPVSLLSGDRKPQIRFLGNHPSGSGNLYHKSFRM